MVCASTLLGMNQSKFVELLSECTKEQRLNVLLHLALEYKRLVARYKKHEKNRRIALALGQRQRRCGQVSGMRPVHPAVAAHVAAGVPLPAFLDAHGGETCRLRTAPLADVALVIGLGGAAVLRLCLYAHPCP